MKHILIPCLFIFATIAACVIPAQDAPAPIPTFDANLISTMVVQTAQALAVLSATPTSTVIPITDTPTETPTPANTATVTASPTLEPVIGEAVVMMPFIIDAPTNPPPAESTLESFVIAELIPPTPAKPGCPAMNLSRETQVIEFINAERAKVGLNALSVQERLVNAAQLHSADMACNNYFNHTALDGSNSGDRVTRAGYPWTFFGENIAAGYAAPEKLVQAWMKSPSHKANILNKNYAEIGVGYAYYADSAYGVYWTAVFGRQ